MASNQLSTDVKEHGVKVDPVKNRVKCNYCDKVVSGFGRLKCHLGGIRGDVTPCLEVPADVKEIFSNELSLKKQVNLSKEVGELYHPELSLKRNVPPKSSVIDLTETESSGTQQRLKRESQSDNIITENAPPPKRQRVLIEIPDSSTKNQSLEMPDESRTRNQSLDEAKKRIARFFYETATDFNVVNSRSFLTMINATVGGGQVIPTCEELQGWILEDAVKEMQNYVKDIKSSWAVTGCSIILDGWKDEKGRDLLNIIVNCPKGAVYLGSSDVSAFAGDAGGMLTFLEDVIEEVGIKNVVQVITYSTTADMKEVGELLMNKHSHIFWTVSASTCLELMLQKIENVNSIRRILEKAKKITRFVHNDPSALKLLRTYTRTDNLIKSSNVRSTLPYLTLENIVLEKEGLKKMFSSSEWKTSDLSCTLEGKSVARFVEDPTFWNGALRALQAAIPIVRALKLINKNNKPQMGLIYETMDQVKETIKEGFRNNERLYTPFWKEIDEIWNNHLHSHLHSAGYYFNPILFYSSDFFPDAEVSSGMNRSVVKMSRDSRDQDLISDQVDKYSRATRGLKEGSEPEWLSDASRLYPVLWWTKYGEIYPQLQRVAIQILSQTCDGAAKFKLNRILAGTLLTKGQNHIEQKKLRDLVFVHYNMQLQIFELSERKCTFGNGIDPMDDWLVDEEAQDDPMVANGEPRDSADTGGSCVEGPEVKPLATIFC